MAKVRDRAALKRCLEALAALQAGGGGAADDILGGINLPDGSASQIKKCRFAGHDIYYLSGQAIAPALTITEHEAVATLNMPAMKAYLSRRDHHSLATQPGVKLALADAHPQAALGYCDTPRLFDFLYPMISAVGVAGTSAGEPFGLGLKPTYWPSASSIRRHLRPDITTLERTPSGLQLTCRYCLPSGGANGILAMMALGAIGNSNPTFTPQALTSKSNTWTPTWYNPFHTDPATPAGSESGPSATVGCAPVCELTPAIASASCPAAASAYSPCPVPAANPQNVAAAYPAPVASPTAASYSPAPACASSVPSPYGSGQGYSNATVPSPYGSGQGYSNSSYSSGTMSNYGGSTTNPYGSTTNPYSPYGSPSNPYAPYTYPAPSAAPPPAYCPAPVPAVAPPWPPAAAATPVPVAATRNANTEVEGLDPAEVREPIDPAVSDAAAEPPTQDEVMKALRKAHRDSALENGVTRTKVRMLIEPVKDAVDPPFAMPQLGLVQMHHVRFKCTVYYTETAHVDLPSPHKTVDENCKEVIYINRDHLHRAAK